MTQRQEKATAGSTPEPAGESPVLRSSPVEGVVRLVLNCPEKYNPLSSRMLDALCAALAELAADSSCRVVLLAANGKAFSAGHDLREVRANDDPVAINALFQRCAEMMIAINELPQPVIAEVGGIATAAGCQLVAACDLAVASEDATFAVSGINYGLFCSAPAVPLSRAIPRKRALQMLLTGDFIDADTAAQWGLINQVVPAAQLASAAESLAGRIAAKSAAAIGLGKRVFYEQLPMPLHDAYRFGAERMACNMDSDDAREGFDAFLEKRKPVWRHR